MAKTHFSGPLNVSASNPEGTILDIDAAGTAAVLGATMTISPETTAESGYIRVDIAGTIYQIPVYAE